MSSNRSPLRGLVAALAFFASAAAFAHPKVVSTTPANHAEVAAPTSVSITFSETLLPVSGAELVMTKMPGMTMPPMKIKVAAKLSTDAKSLVLTPAKPLGTGSYRVDWHVVSTDTHAVKGSFDFIVK
ncbi:MAG: copper homeostasis periplasmic binding protein CopC [Proteobacteria bacterium]|nr:copper homeostasis periplasmic binding protein CopC [Pseudomonadota bacterium]